MPTEVRDVVPWTEPGANGDGSEEQRGQWQQNNTNISLKNTGRQGLPQSFKVRVPKICLC